MNPNITKISIYKNDGAMNHGDLLFNAQGNCYNNSCYISELVYGSYSALSIIQFIGLSPDDINWIEQRAMELYKDRKHRAIEFHMRSGKISKY